MKINSNTIKLEKESYQKLEEVIKKIASENKIENVENVEVRLSKNGGIVKFAINRDEDVGEIETVLASVINNLQEYVGEELQNTGMFPIEFLEKINEMIQKRKEEEWKVQRNIELHEEQMGY